MTTGTHTYTTLEDLRRKKTQLSEEIDTPGEKIAALWHELAAPKEANTKGEMVASLISNSITAFDAFLLVKKIMRQYGPIIHWFRKRKKK